MNPFIVHSFIYSSSLPSLVPLRLPLQMDMFRSLLFSGEGEDPCNMMDNYRPPQPLKGRLVRASFK